MDDYTDPVLAQQAATANALRGQAQPPMSTLIGNALGGIGRRMFTPSPPRPAPRYGGPNMEMLNPEEALSPEAKEGLRQLERQKVIDAAADAAANEAGLVFDKRVSKGPIRYAE